jgi:hypothetical protein
MHRTGRFLAVAIVVSLGGLALVSTGTARADSPDFSVCDGLPRGAAGLCRAGVAVGCADELPSGNLMACQEIEEQYRDVAGTEPPWLAAPCPCAISTFPTALWPSNELADVLFSCPPLPEVTELDGQAPEGVFIYMQVGFRAPWGLVCDIADGTDSGTFNELEEISISTGSAASCRQDLIAYGNALAANNDDDITVVDSCLE